jgi:hypothetical protein
MQKRMGGGKLPSFQKLIFVIGITETSTRSYQSSVVGGRLNNLVCVMVRFVAFLVLGSAFVTGIVTTVQTHRLSIEPKVLLASTPVNYVNDHWPSAVTIRASASQ